VIMNHSLEILWILNQLSLFLGAIPFALSIFSFPCSSSNITAIEMNASLLVQYACKLVNLTYSAGWGLTIITI